MPFSLVIVLTSLINFDMTLERAARVMGANAYRAFWNVTFPYIRPAVISSALFSFFISFDELVIALFISGKMPDRSKINYIESQNIPKADLFYTVCKCSNENLSEEEKTKCNSIWNLESMNIEQQKAYKNSLARCNKK